MHILEKKRLRIYMNGIFRILVSNYIIHGLSHDGE